jgi:hypothetical protein
VDFSGTVRSVTDEEGEVVSQSLRCAYGDDLEPVLDLTVTWGLRPDAEPGCEAGRDRNAVVEVERNDGVDPGDEARAAAALLEGAEARAAPCPAEDGAGGSGLGRGLLIGLGLGLVGAVVVLAVGHRRSGAPAPHRLRTALQGEGGSRYLRRLARRRVSLP